MLLGDRYSRYVLFDKSENKDVIPHKVFWIAIFIVFLIANAPPKRISPVLAGVLQFIPETFISCLFHQSQDLQQISNNIVFLLVAPLKELLFFIISDHASVR